MKENDRLRASYVQHFYGVDASSPKLYHLILNTVRLRWDEAEAIIVAAARQHDNVSEPAPEPGQDQAG